MRAIRRLAARLAELVRRRHGDEALREEMETHIAMQTEDYIRRGVAPADAARAARLKFGGLAAAGASCRDQRRLPWLDAASQDVRDAVRGMRRSPGFTALAVLSIGIGIGANAAIFSVVRGVLLRPLGYHDPDRLFAVREAVDQVGGGGIAANPLHVREWRRQCPSLASVGASRLVTFTLMADGEAEQVSGAHVDPEFLPTLGVEPRLGRGFLQEEAQRGRDRVVLLADSLWRRRYGADPGIVGRTIDLGGLPYQVVGVLPSSFRLPFSGGLEPYSALTREPEIYQVLVVGAGELRALGNFNYGAIARLAPGATRERALAEIDAVQAQFPRLAGEPVKLDARLVPLQDLFFGRVRPALWTLMGAVGAVLLIVCVNLANLLVARMTARQREAAIRTALGATRLRLLRQLVTGSLMLAALGGALGLAIAAGGVRLLVRTAPPDLPRLDQITLDWSVALFALAMSLATGLAAGLLPARASMRDPQDALKSGGRTATAGAAALRTRHALIGLEVAVSTALLIVAGLLMVSFVNVTSVDKGFDSGHVLAVDVSLTSVKFSKEPERERLLTGLLARVRSLPGAVSSGLVTVLPSRGEAWIDPVWLEGETRPVFQRPLPNTRVVSPGYFRTMGIVVLRGREYEDADRGRPVAVVSEKLAQQLWPGADPIGRHFVNGDGEKRTVIGVVADVRATLTAAPAMIVYYGFWSRAPYGSSIVVRSTGNPGALASLARAAVRDADPAVAIRAIRTLDDVVDASVAQRRFQLFVVAVFAASALLVAALGIYGVVAFSVASRRSELGVRVALGARPADLCLLVIRQGMRPVVLGLAGGLGLALLGGGAIRSLLFGVGPADPVTIAGVLTVLTASALVACFIPARAAALGDPVKALRAD